MWMLILLGTWKYNKNNAKQGKYNKDKRDINKTRECTTKKICHPQLFYFSRCLYISQPSSIAQKQICFNDRVCMLHENNQASKFQSLSIKTGASTSRTVACYNVYDKGK